jgi:DtxR family transcriptional regulator, Mn-dependent transcriptional regulator
MEDYLEAIYELEKKNRVARITDIAELLQIKKSSATKALKALAEKDLVNYEPYKFITLKKAGLERARKITSKHRILSSFANLFCSLMKKLRKKLAVKWNISSPAKTCKDFRI